MLIRDGATHEDLTQVLERASFDRHSHFNGWDHDTGKGLEASQIGVVI